MKNKNTVIALLVVFVSICAYNLYWTYEQYQIEKRISPYKEVADSLSTIDTSRWSDVDFRSQFLYDSISAALSADRQKAAANSFTLGLDLQGGMYVTMEVKIEDLIRQLAGNPGDELFEQSLACATEARQQAAQAYVPLFIDCYSRINPEGNLGALFASEEAEIGFGTPDDDVIKYLNEQAVGAMDRTFNILRDRVDQFGVVSPNIQQLDNNRILLELPGVKDENRIIELLKKTAKLEFFTSYNFREAFPVLMQINEKLREIKGLDSTSVDTTAAQASVDNDETNAEPDTSLANSDSSVVDSTAPDSQETPFDQMTEEEQQEAYEEFKRENPLFAVLERVNYQMLDPQSNTPLVGYAIEPNKPLVNEYLNMDEIKALIPEDMRFVWSYKPQKSSAETEGTLPIYELIAIRTSEDGEPAMGGGAVATARQDYNQQGEVVVTMAMTPDGADEWARITETNVNNHVAVLLDNQVYSYPRVINPIRDGRTEITGGFDLDEAKDLANVLEAGQLPVSIVIEGSQTVGPSLGEENINNGLKSFLVAFIITLIFMGIYYAKAGLVANVALIANLIFILGCSAAFTIVFTLPGMAAVVLTVGMAVDANVLIFERIREELAKDKTLKASIKAGFGNAFSSVMDANITTFLTGVVLFGFGVGPIRGFAVSLMIGILTSLISALIITRLILDYYSNKGSDALNFGFSWTTGLFDKIRLNMVGKRKTFYMISGALVLASLISIFSIGFKTGVDFQGGRQFEVEFYDAQNGAFKDLSSAQVNQIRSDLADAFAGNEPVIKTLSSDHKLMITSSYLVDDREADSLVKATMLQGLATNFGESQGYEIRVPATTNVGPTVANDIRQAAYFSVIFSLLIIFFYILVRFRKWQYSLGAIAAVFHDVLIVLGIYSFLSLFDLGFSVEINQPLIAALLTIIGYSINDTVVVFDRIRENLGEMKASKLTDIYNISIDQTISRTLITSVTTLLVVLILFLFGGDGLKGFVFAIIIGVIVGTYSSIFVASPISLDTILRGSKEDEA